MECIGINCGAGTLLAGVRKFFRPAVNYQTFKLGEQTCAAHHMIPSIELHGDYSKFPKHGGLTAVFANAEDWLAAQLAVQYAVSNKVPILMLDVRASFWGKYESFFADCAELAHREGYRTTYLIYSCLSFDAGFKENRFTFCCHLKDRNFNVTTPKLPTRTRNVYNYISQELYQSTAEVDAAGIDYDKSSHYTLEYEEQVCLRYLEKGWTLREAADKRMYKLPGTARKFLATIVNNSEYQDIYKLSWNWKPLCSSYKHRRFAHPTANRTLTVGEMMRIAEWDKLPLGAYPIEQMMYGTPMVVAKWLGLQAALWYANKWGDTDNSLRYDKKEQKFKGGEANPFRPKKFISISEYYNENYDTSDVKYFPPKKTTLDLLEDFVEY